MDSASSSNSPFLDEFKRLSESLILFGLSEREANVYLTLLVSGGMRAGELAKELRLHRLDAYNALKNLQERDLVEATLSKPMVFKAVGLDNLVEMVRQKQRDEIKRKSVQLADLEGSAKRMEEMLGRRSDEWRDDKTSEKIQILSGRKAISEKWSNLLTRAKSEILVAATEKGIARSLLSDNLDLISNKRKHGVKVRVFTPVTTSSAEQYHGFKDEVRHLTASTSAALCVVDSRHAMIVVEPYETISFAPRNQNAIVTDSRSLVEMLRTLFFVGWDTSPVVDEVLKTY